MTRPVAESNGHDGESVKQLPKDFVWGYATGEYRRLVSLTGVAAQQIEGGVRDDGRGESIWDRFAQEQKRKVQDGSNSDIVGNSLDESLTTRLATRITFGETTSLFSNSTKRRGTVSPSLGRA